MSLPEFSIRYPVTIAMATLAVVLLGIGVNILREHGVLQLIP